jgi:hypothetical protein
MPKPSEPYLRDLQFRGVIEGLTYLDKSSLPQCHFFGGIPFGLPPVGPFRFQRPRSLPTCYRYGTRSNPGRFTGACSLCPQHGRRGLDDELWDEDCLQSNIWVPIGEPPAGGMIPHCRVRLNAKAPQDGQSCSIFVRQPISLSPSLADHYRRGLPPVWQP